MLSLTFKNVDLTEAFWNSSHHKEGAKVEAGSLGRKPFQWPSKGWCRPQYDGQGNAQKDKGLQIFQIS